MKYEVILTMRDNDHIVNSWRFKSITQVCRYLDQTDYSLVRPKVFRLPDYKEFDANLLLEIWKC